MNQNYLLTKIFKNSSYDKLPKVKHFPLNIVLLSISESDSCLRAACNVFMLVVLIVLQSLLNIDLQ